MSPKKEVCWFVGGSADGRQVLVLEEADSHAYNYEEAPSRVPQSLAEAMEEVGQLIKTTFYKRRAIRGANGRQACLFVWQGTTDEEVTRTLKDLLNCEAILL